MIIKRFVLIRHYMKVRNLALSEISVKINMLRRQICPLWRKLFLEKVNFLFFRIWEVILLEGMFFFRTVYDKRFRYKIILMNRMCVAQCHLFISEIYCEQSKNNTKYAPIVTSSIIKSHSKCILENIKTQKQIYQLRMFYNVELEK